MQFERLDERVLMAADSFLSVVAPNGNLATGAYTMPTGDIDPNLADQYVPIADLTFTLNGTTYSGSPSSGGPPPSPTQFQSQSTAHFQNGVFVGTNFSLIPIAGGGSGSTPGGSSTNQDVATVDGGTATVGNWSSVSVVDTVAHFLDSVTFADAPKPVSNNETGMVGLDFSAVPNATAAFELVLEVTYTDTTGVDRVMKYDMQFQAGATSTQIRNGMANLIGDDFRVIKDGNNELTVKDPFAGAGKLKNLNLMTTNVVYRPKLTSTAGNATYTNN